MTEQSIDSAAWKVKEGKFVTGGAVPAPAPGGGCRNFHGRVSACCSTTDHSSMYRVQICSQTERTKGRLKLNENISRAGGVQFRLATYAASDSKFGRPFRSIHPRSCMSLFFESELCTRSRIMMGRGQR